MGFGKFHMGASGLDMARQNYELRNLLRCSNSIGNILVVRLTLTKIVSQRQEFDFYYNNYSNNLMYHQQQNKRYPKGVCLLISELHSILAVAIYLHIINYGYVLMCK